MAMPLSLHTGTRRWQPGADGNDPTLVDIVERTNKEHDVRIALAAMIFAGVFERYPRLKVGAVEFEVAWAPYFLARMGNLYTEQAIGVHGRRFKGGAVPGDFFRQNCFLSFQEDTVGIQLRGLIGVETLLWGSDYPHAESTFPRSRAIVKRILQSVPDEEQALIAGGNTVRLYHFDAVH
jgi:predicted TIM-barrel fold metal-dependent hydrolase